MREMSAITPTCRWTSEWARRSLLVAFSAALAGTAACGGDSATGPGGARAAAGRYTIQTVNGKSLPVAIFADTNYTYEVTTGTLTLGVDGMYSKITTFRQTIPGNIELFVDSSGGTWLQSGSVVQFTTAPDSMRDSATFIRGRLTFADVLGRTPTTFVYGPPG